MNAIKNFMQDEEGAVAIEYALLAALIAIAIIAGATTVGHCLNNTFVSIANVLKGQPWAAPTCT
ncbi:Flp family type IVb pilin [Herminiimonas sp. CN]|uniref:Flp family type IVb pilin n=1 Tax=Herminiimonas sp. CN TaxID=1349818 RepID=UPI000473CC8D|nr:Flp family type IVb pilin [Herminiimonas sp. CN]